ncbi:MAG: hypothetical protein HY755_08020 [Nitrospirae bacterium]|nr:hypothetical protein [Nitrospirota bacterium]
MKRKVATCKLQRSKKIFSMIFIFSLFTFHFSLSYAENLSDIKLSALQSPVKEIIKEKWGRDPFIRYEDSVLKKERIQKEDVSIGLKVEGIISDGERALAIINGGFYRKNEKVNDFMIVGINKDRVILEKSGKKFYLGIEKFAIESALGGQKGGRR